MAWRPFMGLCEGHNKQVWLDATLITDRKGNQETNKQTNKIEQSVEMASCRGIQISSQSPPPRAGGLCCFLFFSITLPFVRQNF